MAIVLYSSSVLIPQLSEQQLGYTATWAGLILAPGAVALIFLIVHRRPHHAVRAGEISSSPSASSSSAAPFLYSSRLAAEHRLHHPDEDARSSQTLGLGFLFVPISSDRLSDRAGETQQRRSGALHHVPQCRPGRSESPCSSALVTTRSQVNMAYLGGHLVTVSPKPTPTLLVRGLAEPSPPAVKPWPRLRRARARHAFADPDRTQSEILAYQRRVS